MVIKKLTEVDREVFLPQLKDIFFISSNTQSFESEKAKEDFFYTWAGIYLEHFPEYTLLAIEEGRLFGYLSGCTDSQSALELLNMASLNVFTDQFESYPAHLHINCHPDSRGKGVGRSLIESYVSILKDMNSPGVHIITGAGADNVKFYEKVGFSYKIIRPLKKAQLCFMGREI